MQAAQDATKRAATGSTQHAHMTRSMAARQSPGERSDGAVGAQQGQRGRVFAEQKEADDVIVLDGEDAETEWEPTNDDNAPLGQRKRRKVGDGGDSVSAAASAAAPGTAANTRIRTPHSSGLSPRLRARPPLLHAASIPQRLTAGLGAGFSSFGSSISSFVQSIIGSSPAPSAHSNSFPSSTARAYTRAQQHTHTAASRTAQPATDASVYTQSHGSWSHDNPSQQRRNHSNDEDDERAINHTFRVADERDFHDTTPYLIYPPHTKRHSVTVTLGDMHRLNPSEFLNDTLIEFYLLYIRDRVVPAHMRHRFHFFNSFLFTRLSEYGSDGVKEVYAHVKGWTKGVNLFEKDWIVLPINDPERHHWSLVVIAHPGRAVRPAGKSALHAALTADKGKQRQQQQQQRAGSGARTAGKAVNAAPKRANGASPLKASHNSNSQPRIGKSQPSITDLFGKSSPVPSSSLLALSSPPLTVPKPTTRFSRPAPRRSQGEEMALLVQQQQGEGRRVIRSNHEALMSPEQQTNLRFTASKENILADMRSSYGKHRRTDEQQRRQDEQWQRALDAPDEGPVISLDTQPAEEQEEVQTEEQDERSAADGRQDRHVDESADGQDEEPTQPAADVDNDEHDVDIEPETETRETANNAPLLPRLSESIPPTLPLPSQPVVFAPPTPESTSPPPPDESADANKRPCILHFDSLRIAPFPTTRIADILRAHLQCEWAHQQQLHGIAIPTPTKPLPLPPPTTQPAQPHYAVPLQSARRFDDKSFPQFDVEVPEQPNDYDCGVYILHFAELFCREPWPNLTDIMRERWFEQRMRRGGDKRAAIRKLVEELRQEEEFERVRLQSEREMRQEQERMRQQREQEEEKAEGGGVYVPDSDDEERARRQGKSHDSAAKPVPKRSEAERQRGGRRSLMIDSRASGSGESSASVNRSLSIVPSSQPGEEEAIDAA